MNIDPVGVGPGVLSSLDSSSLGRLHLPCSSLGGKSSNFNYVEVGVVTTREQLDWDGVNYVDPLYAHVSLTA